MNVGGSDVVALREPFLMEVHSRLAYLGGWLVEVLGNYFSTVNETVIRRFDANPTNVTANIDFPLAVTSDAVRDLYGSVLMFKRYDRTRIQRFVPTVADVMKRRY